MNTRPIPRSLVSTILTKVQLLIGPLLLPWELTSEWTRISKKPSKQSLDLETTRFHLLRLIIKILDSTWETKLVLTQFKKNVSKFLALEVMNPRTHILRTDPQGTLLLVEANHTQNNLTIGLRVQAHTTTLEISQFTKVPRHLALVQVLVSR